MKLFGKEVDLIDVAYWGFVTLLLLFLVFCICLNIYNNIYPQQL